MEPTCEHGASVVAMLNGSQMVAVILQMAALERQAAQDGPGWMAVMVVAADGCCATGIAGPRPPDGLERLMSRPTAAEYPQAEA